MQKELRKKEMLNGLDLFSGIGGLSIALEPWVRPTSYCESDRYCQGVLLSRMWSGDLAYAPIWDDVRTLHREVLAERIDIIYGGFPCQDISTAGHGIGLEGKRSGLFFEIIRLASEIRPRFIFLENVPAITVRGLDRILLELAKIGYDSRWTIVSASEVGAPHKRERWFLLAHASSARRGIQSDRQPKRKDSSISRNDGEEKSLAHSDGQRWKRTGWQKQEYSESSRSIGREWWKAEPSVGRVAHGIQNRVDRLRGLGNAVVPIQAREAFKRLMGII